MPEARYEPKISLPEALFAGALFLLADLADLLLGEVFISDIIAFPVSQLYLTLKGVRGTYNLMMGAVEIIPGVGLLPLRTVGFLITVWIDRHPALEAVVAKGAELAKPGVGTAGAVEEAGVKTAAGVGAVGEVGGAGVRATTAEAQFAAMSAEPASREAVGATQMAETARGARVIGGVERFVGEGMPAGSVPEEKFERPGMPEGKVGLTEEEYLGEKSPLEELRESLENLPETRKKEWGGVDIDDEKNQVHLPRAA